MRPVVATLLLGLEPHDPVPYEVLRVSVEVVLVNAADPLRGEDPLLNDIIVVSKVLEQATGFDDFPGLRVGIRTLPKQPVDEVLIFEIGDVRLLLKMGISDEYCHPREALSE